MSVARHTEITATSTKGFDDAVKSGIERSAKTLKNLTAAWVDSQEVRIVDGKAVEYRVRMKVTFILND